MRKIYSFLLLLFLLFPLSVVDGAVIISGKRYTTNLPMQNALINMRSSRWLFYFDSVNDDVLMSFDNGTGWWVIPSKIIDCGSAYGYDVCAHSPYIYVVSYPSKETGYPLKCKIIKPYSNRTFVDVEEFVVVSGIEECIFSNPSIMFDGDKSIFVSYDGGDGYLYLSIFDMVTRTEVFVEKFSDKSIQGLWNSRLIRLFDGTCMIIYSEKTGRILSKSYLGDFMWDEAKIVCNNSRLWSGAWSVNWIPDKERSDKCVALTYQANNGKIHFVPHNLKTGWGNDIVINETSKEVAPIISRLRNDWYVITWEEIDFGVLRYMFSGEEDAWDVVHERVTDHQHIDGRYLSVDILEQGDGSIGMFFLSTSGLVLDQYFISTGTDVDGKPRRSRVLTTIKILVVLMVVFAIVMRMLGIRK